jgi:PAS domain S-box-containing protein
VEAYTHQQAAIAVTDADGMLIYCNTVFAQLSGLNRDALHGTMITRLLARYSERFRDDHFCHDLLIHDDSTTTVAIKWPNDRERKYSVTHSYFKNMDNHASRVFTLLTTDLSEDIRVQVTTPQQPPINDLSILSKEHIETTQSLIETNVELRKKIRQHQLALKALRESESRFRNLTETTSDFIWEIDRAGKYTYVSPKSLELLGYPPQDLLHTTSLLFQDASNVARFIVEIESLGPTAKGFQGWEYLVSHKNGHEVVMESSGEPIFDGSGKLSGFRGIDRDITERIEYERKLKTAKKIAEKANEAKSEFLANMSHELRTPLHAILSYSRYGEKKVDSANRADLHHYFHQIGVSANRLFPLIDSLLDLSKLEAGKMNYSLIYDDLRIEIESAISEMRHLAEKRQITFHVQQPKFTPSACYDRERLGQVIRNILSNALKFSKENTQVEICFTLDKSTTAEGSVKTTITNTGVGIPETELEAIFDKFVQSSKTRTGAGGTGLGLSICRNIISDMRGQIWAENTHDGKTQFHFTLPATPAAEKIGQILLQKGLVSREDLEIALRQQKIHT